MANIYKTTQTHEDFVWPRLVPLIEKPSQPPLKTGIRIFYPEPDTRICKEQTYDDFEILPERHKIKTTDVEDGILMNRKKAMLLNEHMFNKYYVCNKLQSTYQIDYVDDEFNYDTLMNKVFKKENLKKQRKI